MTNQQLSLVFMDNCDYFPEDIWHLILFHDLVFNKWTVGVPEVYGHTHAV